jgi:exodeoxyribonuclease V alpha subunit
MIKMAWAEQKEIREVMLFLQSHGVSTGYGAKIYKQYGNEAIRIVQENPYRLATDIFGIGFITADKIAEKLGLPKDSELRAGAGILYVLQQLTDEGHVYFPYEPLVEKCREILQVDREIIIKAFGTLAEDQQIVIEDLNQDLETFQENHKAVYLSGFYRAETNLAARLKRLLSTTPSIRPIDADKAISWVQEKLSHHPG